MNSRPKAKKPFNRRAFLRGAGTTLLGLPFLEGLPERSAWAQGDSPVFSFFVMSQNGIVQPRFWPEVGPLSAGSMSGKTIAPLADYAQNMLLVRGMKFPGGSPSNCGHAQGCVQALTGAEPGSGGNGSTSGGPSADYVIAQAMNPAGVDPLTLYSGTQGGAYIAERASFARAKSPARSAQLNPYETYKSLAGLAGPVVSEGPNGSSPVTGPSQADIMLARSRSVNDLVLDDFSSLMAQGALSAEDRMRLDNHLQGFRQLEMRLMETGEAMNEMNDGQMMPAENPAGRGCGGGVPSQGALDAFKNGIKFNRSSHMIEDIVKLHGETVALAFACNANRTASLQWGDGTDGTVYNTNATGGYNTFHKISHRTNSNTSSGNDKWAEEAHAEIDTIRAQSMAHIFKVFGEYGLFDKSIIYWTNSLAHGPAHSFDPCQVLIGGSGGGFLRQGETISGSGSNAKILSSVIEASGVSSNGFGSGGGPLTAAHA